MIDYGFELHLDPGETATLRRHEPMPGGVTVLCEQTVSNTAEHPFIVTAFGLRVDRAGVGHVVLHWSET